jgi:malonate-semialdehyde dehydrogenase (acetylating)/methylmalonate-semialdehyde dehydrogenase
MHEGTARTILSQVQAGMVSVNASIPGPMAFHSFGDRNAYGPEGVDFYTKLKTTTAHWPTGLRAGAAIVIPTMK